MKKITSVFLLIALSGALAIAQGDKSSYDAYLSGLSSLWESSVAQQQAAYDKMKTNEALFTLTVTQYGLLNATMKDSNEELFDKYIDAAEANLDKLVQAGHKSAESKAMLSALTGLSIAYSSWKGMFLGPKSASLIDEALEEAPASALVRKLHGNYLQFTPEMWGGDKAAALTEYRKAVELFEQENTKDNWLYFDTLAWLGIALTQQGEKAQAKEVYLKALAAEPDFQWIKHGLLPDVQ